MSSSQSSTFLQREYFLKKHPEVVSICSEVTQFCLRNFIKTPLRHIPQLFDQTPRYDPSPEFLFSCTGHPLPSTHSAALLQYTDAPVVCIPHPIQGFPIVHHSNESSVIATNVAFIRKKDYPLVKRRLELLSEDEESSLIMLCFLDPLLLPRDFCTDIGVRAVRSDVGNCIKEVLSELDCSEVVIFLVSKTWKFADETISKVKKILTSSCLFVVVCNELRDDSDDIISVLPDRDIANIFWKEKHSEWSVKRKYMSHHSIIEKIYGINSCHLLDELVINSIETTEEKEDSYCTLTEFQKICRRSLKKIPFCVFDDILSRFDSRGMENAAHELRDYLKSKRIDRDVLRKGRESDILVDVSVRVFGLWDLDCDGLLHWNQVQTALLFVFYELICARIPIFLKHTERTNDFWKLAFSSELHFPVEKLEYSSQVDPKVPEIDGVSEWFRQLSVVGCVLWSKSGRRSLWTTEVGRGMNNSSLVLSSEEWRRPMMGLRLTSHVCPSCSPWHLKDHSMFSHSSQCLLFPLLALMRSPSFGTNLLRTLHTRAFESLELSSGEKQRGKKFPGVTSLSIHSRHRLLQEVETLEAATVGNIELASLEMDSDRNRIVFHSQENFDLLLCRMHGVGGTDFRSSVSGQFSIQDLYQTLHSPLLCCILEHSEALSFFSSLLRQKCSKHTLFTKRPYFSFYPVLYPYGIKFGVDDDTKMGDCFFDIGKVNTIMMEKIRGIRSESRAVTMMEDAITKSIVDANSLPFFCVIAEKEVMKLARRYGSVAMNRWFPVNRYSPQSQCSMSFGLGTADYLLEGSGTIESCSRKWLSLFTPSVSHIGVVFQGMEGTPLEGILEEQMNLLFQNLG